MSSPLLRASLSPGRLRHTLRFREVSLWQPQASDVLAYELETSVHSTEVEGLASLDGELLQQYGYLSGVAADALRVRSAQGVSGGTTLAYPIGVITWARPAS